MVERTAYKDTFFIRELFVPFFWYMDFVHLSCSDRISKNSVPGGDFFIGSPEDVAQEVGEIIRDRGLAQRYALPYAPELFIDGFAFENDSNLPIERLIDVGAAAALAGRFGLARECLEVSRQRLAKIAKTRPNRADRLPAELDAALTALDLSGAHLQHHLQTCCYRNAEALGFAPTPPA